MARAGAISYIQTGGMTKQDKENLRQNLQIGDIIPVTKANGKRGLVTRASKVIAKYKHYFVVHNGRYKETFLYIDLHSPPSNEEVEE